MGRVAGITGGVGPESTIEYYRAIVAGYRAQVPDDSYPRLVIKYMNELVNGIVRSETHARVMGMVDRLRGAEKIDGVILGGTELSLLIGEPDHHGIPFLDTAKLHVARVVDEMLA